MSASIEDQVVDFYYSLFSVIFTEPFRSKAPERLKRDAVARQIQDAAGAASQSLTRFLLNERLTGQDTESLLEGFGPVQDLLRLEDLANPNVPPENLVDELLPKLPCPTKTKSSGKEAVYRLALHSVVQVLKLVGPIMAEWLKVNFSGSYEPSRRVISKLNQITEQLGALGAAGQAARDELYELNYRDYLLQRFHRVEAGTVRMTTSQDVSLTELFVMPKVLPRPRVPEPGVAGESAQQVFMNLAAARQQFVAAQGDEPKEKKEERGNIALDQIRHTPRNVVVGAPGGGKSTFLEWLQLKLAGGEEVLSMAGQQAIPLLLRVRQLNPREFPGGAALIERATASKDIAALMPPGWIERQMSQGRVLFMLDGLDELDPESRDSHLLPWLLGICRGYPGCRYLVSSRPEGYPIGTLRKQDFVECDLLDFNGSQVAEYTRHWCTAVRLARNEAETEAKREGKADGERIVEGFKDHPYTRNLACNPLMLSAICLVNYFEGGQLPKDRAVLYRLCVEGLLHNWDERRGIRSEFGFDEKLRACREVAVAMQADDRAEYEASKVQTIFAAVLDDPVRAQRLLEHIRRRTGLLLERRPGAFAFAHLTFQEYLAARAVHEGNRIGVGVDRLLREHDDGRWQEVIALYCGLAPAPAAREMIEGLIACQDSYFLSPVLTEAYLCAGAELSRDGPLRRRVIERIAVAPGYWPSTLDRFGADEVQPIANALVGVATSGLGLSGAYRWLYNNPESLNEAILLERVRKWPGVPPVPLSELVYLLHEFGSNRCLTQLAKMTGLYSAPGPSFAPKGEPQYSSQAEVAVIGLQERLSRLRGDPSRAWGLAFLQVLRALVKVGVGEPEVLVQLARVLEMLVPSPFPTSPELRRQYMAVACELAQRLKHQDQGRFAQVVGLLNRWSDILAHQPATTKESTRGHKWQRRNRAKR